MTVVPNFHAFVGKHCETTTTGNLLHHAGLPLSEPMLFGAGMGIGFGVFQFKGMATPFIGGRIKGEELTKNLATNLGFQFDFRTTRSKKKAWQNVASFIDQGVPVAAKLDAYFLDYFDIDVHFAGHYLTVYGYDADSVFVVDTDQQGGKLKTGRGPFEEARLWKGPMASNAMTWTVEGVSTKVNWPQVLTKAIAANARSYLNPPIRNFGAKGIRKAAKMVPGWMETLEDPKPALAQLGGLMEGGGTGGGLFRFMYADFLTEANAHLQESCVDVAASEFLESANLWRAVSQMFKDATAAKLAEASAIMLEIADLEEAGCSRLAGLSR